MNRLTKRNWASFLLIGLVGPVRVDDRKHVFQRVPLRHHFDGSRLHCRERGRRNAHYALYRLAFRLRLHPTDRCGKRDQWIDNL